MSDRDAEACRRMWQAVVHTAVCDALLDGADNRDEKDRADAWIRNGGRDFRQVCALAGIDADFLRDAYVAGRINPDALRKDRKGRNAGKEAAE